MAVSSIVNKVLKECFQNSNNNVVSNNNIPVNNNNGTGNSNMLNNNNNKNNTRGKNYGQLFILLILVILWLCLTLLVGKYLWNECLCKAVSICKPIDNVFVLLGIIVLVDILRPNL